MRRCVRTLLKNIELTPADLIIVLGDTIDRGPNSRGVLDILLKIQKSSNLVFILGNHEEMMLNAFDRGNADEWFRHGGKQTLASYAGNFDNIPDEHFELLDNAVAYYEGPTYICVHANLEPRG